MAAGRVLRSSNKNYIKHLELTSSHVLPKYKEYLEYNDNTEVKCTGGLTKLKTFITEIFGDEGIWSSPSESSNLYRGDNVSITWYANKGTLIFQGESGDKPKDLMTNFFKCKARTNLSKINTEATPQITNLHCSKRSPKATKTPTANDKTMRVSEEASSASDCSTLKDLENFIDQSLSNIWSPSVNGNVLTVQSSDCSTPLIVQTDEKTDGSSNPKN